MFVSDSKSLPQSVKERYLDWVDCFHQYWDRRCNDYHAPIFVNKQEAVAWYVAGYLLAWRIVASPDVGSVEWLAGPSSSEYLLEKGNETAVTLEFLREMVDILDGRMPAE